MKELQIKVLNTSPATVNFNYDQISTQLDALLDKYKGLVFTEETATECRKTVAELRKGQKSLDDFRKATKKKLTESVTEFENQCKKLYAKFNDVLDPLVEQVDEFEEQRKEEKRKKIQLIIDELIEDQGLIEKFSNQLIIPDSYLTKSKTMKSIKEELTLAAENLGIQQDQEEANEELIKTNVKLANATHGVTLFDAAYISLLEYEDPETIIKKINEDAEGLKNTKELKEKQELPKAPTEPAIKSTPKEDEEIFVEKYEVEGTDNQLEALEEFMSARGLKWKVI